MGENAVALDLATTTPLHSRAQTLALSARPAPANGSTLDSVPATSRLFESMPSPELHSFTPVASGDEDCIASADDNSDDDRTVHGDAVTRFDGGTAFPSRYNVASLPLFDDTCHDSQATICNDYATSAPVSQTDSQAQLQAALQQQLALQASILQRKEAMRQLQADEAAEELRLREAEAQAALHQRRVVEDASRRAEEARRAEETRRVEDAARRAAVARQIEETRLAEDAARRANDARRASAHNPMIPLASAFSPPHVSRRCEFYTDLDAQHAHQIDPPPKRILPTEPDVPAAQKIVRDVIGFLVENHGAADNATLRPLWQVLQSRFAGTP